MKKLVAAALCAVLLLGFASCGTDELAGFPYAGSEPVSSRPAPVPSSAAASSAPPQSAPAPAAANVLTGAPLDDPALQSRRPVAVMVANNDRALPQRGVAAADVLVEALAEKGATQLVALYTDYTNLPQVGPVRALQDQFLQMVLPQNPILVHIDGSVYAQNLLNVLQYQDIDGIYLGNEAFTYDVARSRPKPGGKLNEYCWFTSADLLARGMETVELPPNGTPKPLFTFSSDALPPAQEVHRIELAYSARANAAFVLNAETGFYEKYAFGREHADEDGTRLAYRNVLVLTAKVGEKPDGLLPAYDFSGGDGVYYTAGSAQKIKWKKGGPNQNLQLMQENGQPLEVQQGKTYIGLLPAGTEGASMQYFSQTEYEAHLAQQEKAKEEAAKQ